MAVETRHAPASTDVGNDLQATVIDLISVALVGKHAHWNVTGPTFRAVHLQLDEVVEVARTGTDRVAERLATIGGAPDGRPSGIASVEVGDLPAGTMSTGEAIGAVLGHLDGVTRRLRERITRIGDADPISEGILIDVTDELEKQAWMLRAQQDGA